MTAAPQAALQDSPAPVMETEVRVTVEPPPPTIEPVAPTVVEPAATALVEPTPPEPPPMIPRNAPEIPRVSLDLPAGSDLVLVETSHKGPSPLEDESQQPRARRARPPRIEVSEEPLQMVETTHKDQTPDA